EAQPLQDLLASLVSEGALVVESGRVRLAGRSATPSPEQQQRIDALLDELRRARFQPPTRDAALERLGGGQEAPDLLAYLVEGGAVVPLGDLVFAPETLDEAKKLLREALGGRTFTVADARDVLGSTRKYVVPLLEYLDRSGFTLRRGDERGFRDE
ncbi:MAG: SelB C-terminal domain-containing protein, partial [Armatimonadota bacterium]